MNQNNRPEFAALVGMIVTFTLAIAVLSGSMHYGALRSRQDMNGRMNQMKHRMESIEKTQDEAFEILEEIKTDQLKNRVITLPKGEERFVGEVVSDSTEVIFTNYYVGDGSNSADITASGLTSKDFEVNEDGMYTYQNKVVLATANIERLPRELSNSYNSHLLYTEIDFVIDDKQYLGIVLDVCGACYGVQGEDKQRYDVFTTKNVIGKSLGSIYK